ncbi:hypothetical protein GQ42DRAFT_76557 [Ramicandelaber brevisporus]|nr:hypothetical protein GQ42DRAFT_76557 [Ramicandelaber brevisporus]
MLDTSSDSEISYSAANSRTNEPYLATCHVDISESDKADNALSRRRALCPTIDKLGLASTHHESYHPQSDTDTILGWPNVLKAMSCAGYDYSSHKYRGYYTAFHLPFTQSQLQEDMDVMGCGNSNKKNSIGNGYGNYEQEEQLRLILTGDPKATEYTADGDNEVLRKADGYLTVLVYKAAHGLLKRVHNGVRRGQLSLAVLIEVISGQQGNQRDIDEVIDLFMNVQGDTIDDYAVLLTRFIMYGLRVILCGSPWKCSYSDKLRKATTNLRLALTDNAPGSKSAIRAVQEWMLHALDSPRSFAPTARGLVAQFVYCLTLSSPFTTHSLIVLAERMAPIAYILRAVCLDRVLDIFAQYGSDKCDRDRDDLIIDVCRKVKVGDSNELTIFLYLHGEVKCAESSKYDMYDIYDD